MVATMRKAMRRKVVGTQCKRPRRAPMNPQILTLVMKVMRTRPQPRPLNRRRNDVRKRSLTSPMERKKRARMVPFLRQQLQTSNSVGQLKCGSAKACSNLQESTTLSPMTTRTNRKLRMTMLRWTAQVAQSQKQQRYVDYYVLVHFCYSQGASDGERRRRR